MIILKCESSFKYFWSNKNKFSFNNNGKIQALNVHILKSSEGFYFNVKTWYTRTNGEKKKQQRQKFCAHQTTYKDTGAKQTHSLLADRVIFIARIKQRKRGKRKITAVICVYREWFLYRDALRMNEWTNEPNERTEWTLLWISNRAKQQQQHTQRYTGYEKPNEQLMS